MGAKAFHIKVEDPEIFAGKNGAKVLNSAFFFLIKTLADLTFSCSFLRLWCP